MRPWDARSREKGLRRCKETGRCGCWHGHVEDFVSWQKQQPAVGGRQKRGREPGQEGGRWQKSASQRIGR